MYINFQQNWVNRSVKPCAQMYLPKNRIFHYFATTNRRFSKSSLSDIRHHYHTCTSFFSKIGLINQSKPCTQIYLPRNANCINLQLAIRISKNHEFRTCTTP